MNDFRRLFLLVGLLIGLACTSAKAEACDGCGSGKYGGGFNVRVDQLPPYFAQFPPVYYAHPVIPRQYGYSPFAHPACGCGKAPGVPAKPVTIVNPYVPDRPAIEVIQPEAEPEKGKTAARPEVILNPYVYALAAVQRAE